MSQIPAAINNHAAVIERTCHIDRGNSNPFRGCYNVLRTTEAPTFTAGESRGLELGEARWGLMPSWWKDAKAPQPNFNARAEEAAADSEVLYELDDKASIDDDE